MSVPPPSQSVSENIKSLGLLGLGRDLNLDPVVVAHKDSLVGKLGGLSETRLIGRATGMGVDILYQLSDLGINPKKIYIIRIH